MNENTKSASDFYNSGVKCLNRFWFLGKNKYVESNSNFIKAAHLYKLEKNWSQAALSYQQSAECQIKLKNDYEASVSYINSAHCYRNIPNSHNMIIYNIECAVRLLEQQKKFCICAKYCIEIANIYEFIFNYENAIDYLQRAIHFYNSEGITNNLSKQKIAELYSHLGNYNKAITIFEELARDSLNSNVKRFMIKEYFMRALLILVCVDEKFEAMCALEKYKSMDVTFAESKECVFMTKLIDAYAHGNLIEFTKIVYEYDSISNLDDWIVTILLKIKSAIMINN